MIAQNFKSYYFSELRLVDGPSRCQGRLEIRPDSSAEFGTACDNDVGSNEATVICRQLNCRTEGAAAVPARTYANLKQKNSRMQFNHVYVHTLYYTEVVMFFVDLDMSAMVMNLLSLVADERALFVLLQMV